jgi:hypothetical protein
LVLLRIKRLERYGCCRGTAFGEIPAATGSPALSLKVLVPTRGGLKLVEDARERRDPSEEVPAKTGMGPPEASVSAADPVEGSIVRW